MAFGAVGLLCAALLIAGAYGLRGYFHGLPPRLFPGVLAAGAIAALALGGYLLRSAGAEVVETSCEVVDRDVREGAGGRAEVHGRVRWVVDGRRLTLFEPTLLRRGDRDAFPVGATLRCRYLAGDPAVIRLRPTGEWRETRRGLGWGLLAAAIPLVAFARRMWRRPGRRAWTRGTRGWVGAVLIAATAGGLFAGEHGSTVGGVVGIAAAAALLGLMIFEVVVSDRAFDRVRKRMRDPQPWPAPPSDGDGIDPYADDRVAGVWKDCRVWVALTHAGAVVEGALEGWPDELELSPVTGVDDQRARTGDDDFDAAVALRAPDAVWRAWLDAPTRAAMIELVGRRGGTVAAARVSCLIGDSEAADLPVVLDGIAALAGARDPASDPVDAVLAAARAEPVAAVRRGHYDWLVARNQDTPLVLRAAATDPDPDIAAWARAQLPPDGGAYR